MLVSVELLPLQLQELVQQNVVSRLISLIVAAYMLMIVVCL